MPWKRKNRAAQFKTVIALHYKGKLLQFEGVCKGEITHTQKGLVVLVTTILNH